LILLVKYEVIKMELLNMGKKEAEVLSCGCGCVCSCGCSCYCFPWENRAGILHRELEGVYAEKEIDPGW